MYSVLSSISISDQRSRGAIAVADASRDHARDAPGTVRAVYSACDRTYFAAMRG
jgi:hypothetical protein